MKSTIFNNYNRNQYFSNRSFTVYQNLNESLLDIYNKNASYLSPKQWQEILKFDPNLYELGFADIVTPDTMANSNESYVRWLLKQYQKGNLNNADYEDVRNTLKLFDYAKKRRNLLPNNDINSYANPNAVKQALVGIKDNLTINQQNKDAKRNQKKLKNEKKPGMYMDGAVELLFIDDKWEVWTPHTFEGSKALRRGAVWCTGGDTSYHYDRYTNAGTLYVLIKRADEKDKYQLFVPNEDEELPREFRDRSNTESLFREICQDDEELCKFFMSREDVNRAFPNLDDPDVDDEWSEAKEEEVFYDWNLSYDDDGNIVFGVDADSVCRNSEYITGDDVVNVAYDGYLDYMHANNSREWVLECIRNPYFVKYVDWENTDLNVLYRMYKKETDSKDEFDNFLQALFNTDGKGIDFNPDAYNWLKSKYGDSLYYRGIADRISTTCFDDVIGNFIANQLSRIDNSEITVSRNNEYRDGSYLYFRLDDCYTARDFYETYVEPGKFTTYSDMMDYFDIRFNDDSYSSDDVDYDLYSAEYAKDDADDITKLFISISEYNNFLTSEEDDDKKDDSDDEVNEVLRIAGVKL